MMLRSFLTGNLWLLILWFQYELISAQITPRRNSERLIRCGVNRDLNQLLSMLADIRPMEAAFHMAVITSPLIHDVQPKVWNVAPQLIDIFSTIVPLIIYDLHGV